MERRRASDRNIERDIRGGVPPSDSRLFITRRLVFGCALAAGIGWASSTGYSLCIALTLVALPLCLIQERRATAYVVSAFYYATAIWPVLPAARIFLGPNVSVVSAALLWIAALLLLAFPWSLAWTHNRRHILWRAPLALLAAVPPPLGLIGWASPLTAAGILFPGAGWCGLAAAAFLCGGLVAFPRSTIAVAAFAVLVAYLQYPGDPHPPSDWEAVNTTFSRLAHGPGFEYVAAGSILDRALCSPARVIIFPETVVPQWMDATDAFWHQTLAALAARGKTFLVGTGIPIPAVRSANSWQSYSSGPVTQHHNAIIIRGSENGVFYQRVPIPIAMWRPLANAGVPLNLAGPGVLTVGGKRAAVLICYEQLLIWPLAASILQKPDLIVAIANDHWVIGTSIPRYQATALKAWSRLFRMPLLSAVNR